MSALGSHRHECVVLVVFVEDMKIDIRDIFPTIDVVAKYINVSAGKGKPAEKAHL